jgi:hypothetical protein
LLVENWFVDFKDAKRKIEAWRADYYSTGPGRLVAPLFRIPWLRVVYPGNGCARPESSQ